MVRTANFGGRFQEALAVLEHMSGPGARNLQTLWKGGLVRGGMGDYARALRLLHELLAVSEQTGSHVARAVCLWFRGAIHVEENDGDNVLHSPSTIFPVPSVVRLRHYIHVRRNTRETTMKRARIYIRDRYRCQYCGGGPSRLTVDHVVPRSRGGNHEWANVVAACRRHNVEKGDRLLEELSVALTDGPDGTTWTMVSR